MEELKGFICLFLETRKLTLSALARLLGYKSRTSLDRLMRENVRPESIHKFERAMLDRIDLSMQETDALHRSVQIAICGMQKYLAMQKMWGVVKDDAMENEIPRFIDVRSNAVVDLTKRYNGSTDLHFWVVNCQYVSGLFRLLKQQMQRNDVRVDHYMYINEDDVRTISAIRAMMSIFHKKGYMGSVYRRERVEDVYRVSGLKEADLLLCTWRGTDGLRRQDLIVFSGPAEAMLMDLNGQDDSFPKLLGLNEEQYCRLKRTYFGCTAAEDYIRYSADYAALEYNRAVWKIKPDVGIDQIPTHILRRAVESGPMCQMPGFGTMVDALMPIYSRRYQNTFHKRKQSHMIMKYSAMLKFVRTGRMSDHFWGLRPFTVQERIEILQVFLENQLHNPYVHFYFLRNDSDLRNVEISYYQGVGMLILESDTDYRLADEHSEILITHERFLDLFHEFYMNVLVESYVRSEAENSKLLCDLIEEARRLPNE